MHNEEDHEFYRSLKYHKLIKQRAWDWMDVQKAFEQLKLFIHFLTQKETSGQLGRPRYTYLRTHSLTHLRTYLLTYIHTYLHNTYLITHLLT